MICKNKKCKATLQEDSLYCNYCGTSQNRAKSKMYQRNDGLFEKSLIINGVRKVFRGKSENEVFKKIGEYKGTEERGPLFNTIAEEWQALAWENLAFNTLKGYNAGYKKATIFFSGKYIKDIKIKDMQTFIVPMITKNYAQKTIKNNLLVVSLIFKHAIVIGILDNNPCEHIILPNNLPKRTRTAPTQMDIELIKSTHNTEMGFFALFILYTGCRLGEAMAITGIDIDYDKKILTINKSIYYDGNQPKIKNSTKTISGMRIIPIPDTIFDMLPRINDNRYLFGIDKEPYKKWTFDKKWRDYKQTNNLDITPHQLRHGYATLLHEAGVEAKDAQALLGHSNIAMTLDVYTHISSKKQIGTFQKFNEYLKNTQ